VASLYEHTDYRSYLREWFDEEKSRKSFMSYRYLSRRVDIDAGFLVHILQGTKHLAESAIPRVVKELQLDTTEGEYFRELVLFNRARGPRQIKEHFQKLCMMRDLQAQEISSRQYRYFLKWQYPALRVALLAFPFRAGDEAVLGARIDPALSTEDVKEGLETLLDLGLVTWNDEGILEPINSFLTTGDRWKDIAVRQFQTQTLQLAQRSIEVHPPEIREVSTLTLAIPAREIPALQEMVREFRQKILQWTASLDDSDAVMQINVASFPLTRIDGQANR
jgi:uncharacterized protein (TIGR02147 family)